MSIVNKLCRTSKLDLSRSAHTRYITKAPQFIELSVGWLDLQKTTRAQRLTALLFIPIYFFFPEEITYFTVSLSISNPFFVYGMKFNRFFNATPRFRSTEKMFLIPCQYNCLPRISNTSFFYNTGLQRSSQFFRSITLLWTMHLSFLHCCVSKPM